jgi:hypothetical protein
MFQVGDTVVCMTIDREVPKALNGYKARIVNITENPPTLMLDWEKKDQAYEILRAHHPPSINIMPLDRSGAWNPKHFDLYREAPVLQDRFNLLMEERNESYFS